MGIAKCPFPKPEAAQRLFLFHHAGGGMSYYYEWFKLLPKSIELIVMELPGRGSSFEETRLTEFHQVIERLGDVTRNFQDKPFSFFGHSMGALLAFGLTGWLMDKGYKHPDYLFASGCKSPDAIRLHPFEKRSQMAKPEIMAALRALGGLPKEIEENDDLLEIFLPIIRDDFAICESFVDQPHAIINVPIISCSGTHDLDTEMVASWENSTSKNFEMFRFEGDHFYLKNFKDKLIEIVVRKLAPEKLQDPMRYIIK